MNISPARPGKRITDARFDWLILGSLLILTSSVSVQAGEATQPRYRLTNGKGYTVCEAFLKNLNALPADEAPMVCEVKIHTRHPEFTEPQWQELDIESNLQIINLAELQIVSLYGASGAKKPSYAEWLDLFRERVRKGEAKPRLRKTTIALDSRGLETVIAYRPLDGQCASDLSRYDYVRGPDDYMFVLRPSPEIILEPIGDASLSRRVLLHNKQPFFFWSAAQDVETWGLRLLSVSPVLPGRKGYFLGQRCEYHVLKATN